MGVESSSIGFESNSSYNSNAFQVSNSIVRLLTQYEEKILYIKFCLLTKRSAGPDYYKIGYRSESSPFSPKMVFWSSIPHPISFLSLFSARLAALFWGSRTIACLKSAYTKSTNFGKFSKIMIR